MNPAPTNATHRSTRASHVAAPVTIRFSTRMAPATPTRKWATHHPATTGRSAVGQRRRVSANHGANG